jgi:antitoxin component YwqK of YwqJK toxin-antitoxin module
MGPHIIWHENGQMKNKEHYKNGTREGLHTIWHDNGQKSTEIHYKDGKEDGKKIYEKHFMDEK